MSNKTATSRDGLDDIAMVRAASKIERKDRPIEKKVVGKFGIQGHIVSFVVTNVRKDTRHGVVNTPAIPSEWYKYQLATMFRGWN